MTAQPDRSSEMGPWKALPLLSEAQGDRRRRVCVGAVEAYAKRNAAVLHDDGTIVEVGRKPEGPGHYVGFVDSLQTVGGVDWVVLLGAGFSTAVKVKDLRWSCWREDADELHPVGEPVR